MARWVASVNIKQFLHTEEDLKVVVDNINLELDKVPRHLRMSGLFEAWKEGAEEAVGEDDVEIFDEALEQLYNWADNRRVWLGP